MDWSLLWNVYAAVIYSFEDNVKEEEKFVWIIKNSESGGLTPQLWWQSTFAVQVFHTDDLNFRPTSSNDDLISNWWFLLIN
jgi:hypothetical protein